MCQCDKCGKFTNEVVDAGPAVLVSPGWYEYDDVCLFCLDCVECRTADEYHARRQAYLEELLSEG